MVLPLSHYSLGLSLCRCGGEEKQSGTRASSSELKFSKSWGRKSLLPPRSKASSHGRSQEGIVYTFLFKRSESTLYP